MKTCEKLLVFGGMAFIALGFTGLCLLAWAGQTLEEWKDED